MSRTRIVNVTGIAVALVLAACWAVGVLWHEHTRAAADTRTHPPAAAPATSAPLHPASGHTGRGAHDRRTAHAVATATGAPQAGTVDVASTPSASATHPATAAHHSTGGSTPPAHHGSGHPSSSPSGHPTSGGTPTPSPSSSTLLSGVIDGLKHLHP